jgi:CRISPR/Cas system CMR-associated protein Cmr3 (group 5 of RAMP superfamily)
MSFRVTTSLGLYCQNRLEELERFQNKAMRLIFWNEYNTNVIDTEGLYKKYKIQKLRLLVKYESSMKIFKISNGSLKSNMTLTQYSDVHDHET